MRNEMYIWEIMVYRLSGYQLGISFRISHEYVHILIWLYKNKAVTALFLICVDYTIFDCRIFHGETTSDLISLIASNAWFVRDQIAVLKSFCSSRNSVRSSLSLSNLLFKDQTSDLRVETSDCRVASAESTCVSNSVFAIERCRKDINIYTAYTYLIKTQKKSAKTACRNRINI